MIWVKCIGIDDKGRVKLSRRAALKERGEIETGVPMGNAGSGEGESRGEYRGGGDRGDRGGRHGDRGDRRGGRGRGGRERRQDEPRSSSEPPALPQTQSHPEDYEPSR